MTVATDKWGVQLKVVPDKHGLQVSISQSCVFAYTPNKERVRVLPRSQIAEVRVVSANKSSDMMLRPSQLFCKILLNLVFAAMWAFAIFAATRSLQRHRINVGVAPKLRFVACATMWLFIVTLTWCLSSRCLRSNGVYKKMVEKLSTLTVVAQTPGVEPIVFTLYSESIDDVQAFLDDPLSGPLAAQRQARRLGKAWQS